MLAFSRPLAWASASRMPLSPGASLAAALRSATASGTSCQHGYTVNSSSHALQPYGCVGTQEP